MPIKTMSWLKWVLLLIASFFLALILDILGGLGMKVGPCWLRWLLAVPEAVLMLVLYAQAVKLIEKEPAHDLPLHRLAGQTGIGLAIGVGYFILVVGTMAAFGAYRISGIGTDWQGIVNSFIGCMFTGIGEEIVFRGVVFRWLDERLGFAAALILSALLFGVMHIANPGATVWSSIAIAIEAGLLLGAAYKFSGTLWLPIGIHWAWNFTQGSIFGLQVSGGDPRPSLFVPSVDGPAWLTGGDFGPEASVIAVVFGALLSAWFIYRHARSH